MSHPVSRLLEKLLPRKRSDIRRDVDEEIEFHLQMRAAELEREGHSPASAREEAVRRFGDVESTRDACVGTDLVAQRARRKRLFLEDLLQDLRFGVAQLRRAPGFAVGAIVTLGVALGAATAVFTAADRFLFRHLPYEADVVTLWEVHPKHHERTEVSPGNYLDWKERSTEFRAMALAEPSGFDFTWTEGPPQAVSAWRVTPEFASILGITPVLGRGFLAEDYDPGAAQAVLVSHRFWRKWLASRPDAAGQTITLDGMPAVVRGVLPDWARYPDASDMWVPKVFRPGEEQDRTSSYMRVVGILKPGATLESARSDLDHILGTADAQGSAPRSPKRAQLVSLQEQIRGPLRLPLLTLLGAVALLVAAACSNVAGLLLTRAAGRRREFSVRAALGASPTRIFRQVLTEGAVLAFLGGALGILLAYAGTRVLAAFGPPELSDLGPPAVDLRVLGFGLLAAAVVSIVSSLGPAIRASREDPQSSLGVGRSDSPSGAENRLRSALVMAQVSLAVVLLIGAGLLLRSFLHLRSADLGFRTEDRVSIQLFLWDRNPTAADRLQKVRAITERFRTVPDVRDVALVSALPFHPHQIDSHGQLTVEGRPEAPGEEGRTATTIVSSPSYFPLLGIPTKMGRAFGLEDGADAPKVAVINETLARRFFPGMNPVGARVRVGVMGPPQLREIVGVVGDVRPVDVRGPARPELYIPYEQSATGSVTFVVRSRHGAKVTPGLLRALEEIDPGQTVYHMAELSDLVSATLSERRFHLILLIAFSSVALFLAALGTYSLVSYATQRRTREIGIRIALGASRRDVLALVLRHGLRPVAVGLILGVAGAMAVTQLLRHMLVEVSPFDPGTIASVGIVLAMTSGLAAYLPARRASMLPPAAAIQFE